MRVLILGGTGMLGHQLYRHMSSRFSNTYATIRHIAEKSAAFLGGCNNSRIIDSIDALDFTVLTGVLRFVKPDIILNCVGITKRRIEVDDALITIELNALLPHRLVKWGRCNSAKVINFSTDCVFDGMTGNYADNSNSNAKDLYGKTKALGEISGVNALTLRSSFIGTELNDGTELLEWLLSQTGVVKGFKNAIYTGLTTLELSRVVEMLITHHPNANGIYNISSKPISKYALLTQISDKLNLNIEVIPDETVKCDRSLNSSKFNMQFRYTPPSWETMLSELSEYIIKTNVRR